MKTLIFIALIALSGCASTSDFFGSRVLSAGESYCTGTPAQCAELYAIAAQLHTPEMNAAINAARIPGKTQ